MSVSTKNIEELAVNTIRTLSMDAVQAANSGHPGTPMALAPVAYALWNDVLRYDPADPLWPNRDRFVLSCGHAVTLLYSVLHLAGVKQAGDNRKPLDEPAVPLDELKAFRQLHSRCPGHPEHGETTGVETTTGPLGQGLATSVGMAIASRWLGAHFNRPGFDLFDYNVYALAGDGDLMEGVSAEAASLAGHLQLSNLCWIYDSNRITIEGDTSLAFSEDVAARFAAYGWNVTRVDDANDLAALREGYRTFLRANHRPTLIVVRSHIAWGSPNKQDTHGAHGAPLGEEEIRLTKAAYGWPEDAKFLVPGEVLDHFQAGIGARGRRLRESWEATFAAYAGKYPELAQAWSDIEHHRLPKDWDADLAPFKPDAKGVASRISSGQVLNQIARRVRWLMGGSADLAPSTMTLLKFDGVSSFQAGNPAGRNLHFGIREHAMAAVLNGLALSGIRPYGSTFLVFSDYLRPAARLSALMHLPVIYIYTHDSIGVGEDGPTHQPIEHIAALRAIPGMVVIRPADANEVLEAWRVIMPMNDRPVSLILTRQNLPTLDRSKYAPASGLARGAYVLADAAGGKPEVILVASGSEVPICVEAYEQLTREGIKARVVSLPSWELFEEQDEAYRDAVLPPDVTARVGVKAAIGQGWDRYVGPRGRFIGMNGFGRSGPAGALAKEFGFTVENVVAQAKSALDARA
ncbi:MAG: transketolase [Pirellulales bacterium]